MNISDSEKISKVLEQTGYKKAKNINMADLIVVNMCSVRQSATDKICGMSQKLLAIKAKKKGLKTILTGCVLDQDKKKFKEKFDFIFSIKDLRNWPKYLKNGKGEMRAQKNRDYLEVFPNRQNNFLAYIPISNGCNNFCSYCVVPYVRGKEICRDHNLILKETKKALKNGAKEIWLLGQNVNSYKSPENKSIDFPRLLKIIDDISGNFWLRFTSPHPKDFSKKMIKMMGKCKKLTPYLNLPMQSGSDKILKKMNRPYTAKKYLMIVKNVRQAIPNIFLSTDVIVGFPGEKKKQFEETKKIFKKAKFDMAYILKYSVRPSTASAKMEDDVSQKEKEKRYAILTEELKKNALKKNLSLIGKTSKVLIQSEKNGLLEGKTKDYRTIVLEGPKKMIGKFITAKIIKATSWGLGGKLISD